MYISLVRFTETSHSVLLERAVTALCSITVKFVVFLKWYQINIFYFVTFWYSIRVRLLSLLALTRLHVCNVAYSSSSSSSSSSRTRKFRCVSCCLILNMKLVLPYSTICRHSLRSNKKRTPYMIITSVCLSVAWYQRENRLLNFH